MNQQLSPILQILNLRVGFDLPEGAITAVDGVSFDINRAKTIALVGESGSGKTVISQTIMGLLPKNAKILNGSILFSDPDSPERVVDIAEIYPNNRKMNKIRGGRISIIFQEPMTSLSALHTVGNQVQEALELHRHVHGREAQELTEDMLRLVGFPNPAMAIRTYPFELSGGLRQRSMIAMALICRPALLIADEPTTALDVTIQAQILKLIRDLQSELKMAVLIITHDLGVVANVADEVVVMYRGRIMESGSVRDIYRSPEHPYLKSLLTAVPRFNMSPDERLLPIRTISSQTGLLLKPDGKLIADEKQLAAAPILEVTGVSKSFTIKKSGLIRTNSNRTFALSDVGFEIQRGECLGLVGESGCGKTTLSKIIMRALSPDSGSISYTDRDGTLDILNLDNNSLIEFRRKLQFVFQDPFSSLNPRMTIFDIVSEPLLIHKIGDESYRREIVRELIRLVGLEVQHLNRYPHSFSGGQRQRIGIARALALRPRLLICDEPVSALDVSIQAQILNLLKDLKKELNLTYLFISHNLAVVDYVADRIAVMCAGRIVELASRDDLFKNPTHPYTKALLAAVPDPDLDNPLNFDSILDDRCSVPSLWGPPFVINAENQPSLIDIGKKHLVRANSSKFGSIPLG